MATRRPGSRWVIRIIKRMVYDPVKSMVDALQRSVPAPRMRVLFGDTLAAKSKVTLAISKGRHHHQRDDGHSRLVNVEQLLL